MACTGHKPRVRDHWNVPASTMVKATCSPILEVVEGMKLTPNPHKPMIALAMGDPTAFGNLKVPDVVEDAVVRTIKQHKYNGYPPSVGYEDARKAVAKYVSTEKCRVEAKDVILTTGCSDALDLCICCLASPGQNILAPCPGFTIYRTLAESAGIKVKYYMLQPEKSWEVDMAQFESLIDDDTAAIVINNPSNPCGSVYSRQHLQEILTLAEKYKIPIIADEIYERLAFSGIKFHPLASLTTTVPVLCCSGLSKTFLVPGWRVGWIVIYDKQDVLKKEIVKGLVTLSQKVLGPTTVIQASLPEIFDVTPTSFYEETAGFLQENAKMFYERLSKVPGLKPVLPQGSIFMMVGIDIVSFPDFSNDLQFTEKLMEEQSLFCLPGKCFEYPNYFRILLTVPKEKLLESCTRIEEFCCNHYKNSL